MLYKIPHIQQALVNFEVFWSLIRNNISLRQILIFFSILSGVFFLDMI